MKTLSMGILAILLAGTTVFANGPVAKTEKTKAKQECQGQCAKNIKTGTCNSKASCSDMNSCKGRCK